MFNISIVQTEFIINILKKYKFFFGLLFGFAIAALIYIAATSKIYLISSRVAIFRIKFEDPDHGSDDSRNRWIWVRDGLNINSAVVSDVEIKKFIDSNDVAKIFTAKLTDDNDKIRFIRSLITVTYTGGDESNYIIDVKSTDARLSFEVNKYFFNYLKYLALQKDQDDFNTLIGNLETAAKNFDVKSSDYQMYRNKITKMKFEQTIAQTQKERAFQIISAPTFSKTKIWPKNQSILTLALLLGALMGVVTEYAVALLKKQNNG